MWLRSLTFPLLPRFTLTRTVVVFSGLASSASQIGSDGTVTLPAGLQGTSYGIISTSSDPKAVTDNNTGKPHLILTDDSTDRSPIDQLSLNSRRTYHHLLGSSFLCCVERLLSLVLDSHGCCLADDIILSLIFLPFTSDLRFLYDLPRSSPSAFSFRPFRLTCVVFHPQSVAYTMIPPRIEGDEMNERRYPVEVVESRLSLDVSASSLSNVPPLNWDLFSLTSSVQRSQLSIQPCQHHQLLQPPTLSLFTSSNRPFLMSLVASSSSPSTPSSSVPSSRSSSSQVRPSVRSEIP